MDLGGAGGELKIKQNTLHEIIKKNKKLLVIKKSVKGVI